MYGALKEIGPFKFKEDGEFGEFQINNDSWNKNTNLLFLEIFPGVGYSFSQTSNDINWSDTKTANVAYEALKNFYNKYKEL